MSGQVLSVAKDQGLLRLGSITLAIQATSVQTLFLAEALFLQIDF